jgi:hypothetical protein
MQVQTLIKALQKLNPAEEICAVVYTKSDFDYSADDEVELTQEAWEKICQAFDEHPENDLWESISLAVSEEAVDK